MRFPLPWVLFCLPTLGMGDALPDSLLACTQPTELAPEQKFGLSSGQVRGLEAKQGQSSTPAAVHAHIVSISRYMNERQVFVLDNVQSWQQIELDPEFTARTGQEVTISSGALGSFWLSTDARHRTRVKRTR
jgi:hypothetical protein